MATTTPDLGQIAEQLTRIEALLERLIGTPPPTPDERLAEVIGSTVTDWFTAAEVWRLAVAMQTAAEATGEPEPRLPLALRMAGIGNAHGLGRWLSAREGQGFERGGVERGGVLWSAV